MKLSKPKYIFVTGGVASSLGKGIISASIARLLQARGYSVTIQKLDPYINVDPGTLNPYEHGECYVTEDGAETDLDLGHYERFTDHPTSKANNVTTGKIYKSVIEKERKGEYLGKTVQVIPHITDEIKRRIQLLGQTKKYDVIITEIGGTVGDIESLPFIESVRQLRYQLGHRNTALVHLTLIPYMAASGELKTKPTQHSVKALLENGLQPDQTTQFYLNNYYCTSTPQTAFNIALAYNAPKMWFFNVDASWLADYYVRLAYPRHQIIDGLAAYAGSPAELDRLASEFTAQEKLPNNWVMNASVGKLIYINRQVSLNLNVSVSNIINNRNLITQATEQFRIDTKYYNPNAFPTKYMYAQGIKVFVNAGVRF